MSIRWTEHQIPDQHGRVAIATGANTGLGFETERTLAEHGATMILAVRDVEKGKQAAERKEPVPRRRSRPGVTPNKQPAGEAQSRN